MAGCTSNGICPYQLLRGLGGAACGGDGLGDDVGGVAGQQLAVAVVPHRGGRGLVAGGQLDVTEWDAGVEGVGDEAPAAAVGGDVLGDAGLADEGLDALLGVGAAHRSAPL